MKFIKWYNFFIRFAKSEIPEIANSANHTKI